MSNKVVEFDLILSLEPADVWARSMLNAEYGALLLEIDRIAQDTEFNGNQLVNGSSATSTVRNSLAGSVVDASDGYASVTFDAAVDMFPVWSPDAARIHG